MDFRECLKALALSSMPLFPFIACDCYSLSPRTLENDLVLFAVVWVTLIDNRH